MYNESEALKERIVINVSGHRFETIYETLTRFPETRLSKLAARRERDENYDPIRKEFFFDRHPAVFSDVLHFYRTKELHLNQNICGNLAKNELEYWGLYEQDIEPCCWTLYTKASTCKETLEALDHTFFSKFDEMDSVYSPKDDALNTSKLSSWQKFRLITWRIIEDPTYSLMSKSYAFLSVFFLTLSIILFVIETYENFRIPKTHPVYINGYGNCTRACGIYYDTKLEHYLDPDTTEPHPVIIYIDYVTFVFFLCDFIIRVVSMRTIVSFMKDLLNWIDLICLVTHAIAIAVLRLEVDYNGSELRAVLTIRVIRGLRIIRVMRIFKLVKHYHAFRILLYTIRVSIRELTLMIVFLLVGGVVFGSLVHLLDRESFRNIPLGLWWALVTMTTVGYGDLVPRQEAAYFVGSVCVIFGVLTIAFTVPIVVNNFQMYYQHAMARNKRPRTYWCQKRTPRVPIFGEDDMKNVDKIIYKNSSDLNCSLSNFNEPKASSDGPEYCPRDLHNNAPPSGCRSSVSSTVTTNLSTIGITSVNVDSKSLPSVNVTEESYHLENYSHQLLASFEEGKLRQNDIIEKQRQRQKTETQKKLDKYFKEKKSDNF